MQFREHRKLVFKNIKTIYLSMSEPIYPFRLNSQAVRLNIEWMDPWFRGQLSIISQRDGITLDETTRKLVGFYRTLEDAVEEEAVELSLVDGPHYQGTNLTVVAPDIPTYLVAVDLGKLIKDYQGGQISEQRDLQQIFSELDQTLQQVLSREQQIVSVREMRELEKIRYCSNFQNVTAYNWLCVAPIANRLFPAQIDYRTRLHEVDKEDVYKGWHSATDEKILSHGLQLVSHEMLSTLIGGQRVHDTDYDRQIEKRLAERFDALLRM